jgi:serine protease inhibitor
LHGLGICRIPTDEDKATDASGTCNTRKGNTMTTKSNRKRLSVDAQLDVDNSVRYIKKMLRKRYNESLINALMDAYDLNSFISSWTQFDYELEEHFDNHAKKVYDALYNF